MNQQTKRRLSVGLFTLGIFVGFFFNTFVVWANFEASLWNEMPTQGEVLDGLHCPLIISKSQSASIAVTYKNPLDRVINPVIRTYISERLVSMEREESLRPEIAPGETARIEYTITGDEAIWNRFILVRVYTLPQFTLPARNGSCGIFVVDIPVLKGGAIVLLIVFVSVAGMGSGLWLWRRIHVPLEARAKSAFQGMVFLSAAVLAGIILELLRVWGLATLLLVMTFILLAAVLAYFLASSD
jgi:hypothetical protein